jgi:hypothetical protein
VAIIVTMVILAAIVASVVIFLPADNPGGRYMRRKRASTGMIIRPDQHGTRPGRRFGRNRDGGQGGQPGSTGVGQPGNSGSGKSGRSAGGKSGRSAGGN